MTIGNQPVRTSFNRRGRSIGPGSARDTRRLGLWGSSFAGGLVIYVAGYDRRVKAVHSQVGPLDLRGAAAPATGIGYDEATRRARGTLGYPKPGEIVVSLMLPKRPKGSSDAYLRLIPRTEMDIAVVGVGVSLTMKGDTVTDARVGLGAVAPTVLLVDKAAKALIGSKLDDAALNAAADACSAACRPIDDKRGTIKYRTKIAGVLLKRSAMIARDRINGIEHRGHRPV